MAYFTIIAGLLVAQAADLTARERLYQHACYTGVAMAQSILPKVPQEDEIMARGFSSCDGSIVRMRRTGELAREENVPEFACGYGVGATFAKYGLGSEAQAGSRRSKRAMKRCMDELRKQGIAK